ncbi:MAG: FAD-binding oxidoreductase [Halodesulfurarchaeum sp.]
MTPQPRSYDCSFLEESLPPGRYSLDRSTREQYSTDESPHPPSIPDAVANPRTTEEVATVLSAASERGVPVVPWSGGSSIEGNPIPVEGGIVLDTFEMDDVRIHAEDRQAVVGPGVVYDDLNETAASAGLRFAPGIAAGDLATVGGMIANNASGLNAVKYGQTREHVLRLEVALPNGQVLELGSDVVKTASGYSLRDLFVGSEGTLGVVTEATVSLEPIPNARRAAIASFETREAAGEAVAAVMRSGITPGAIEYLDTRAIAMVGERTTVDVPDAPTIILEVHGESREGAEAALNALRNRCDTAECTEWHTASGENIADIWQARRDVYPAACEYREDATVAVIGDVTVPVSKYPSIIEKTVAAADDLDVTTPCVGHAGDGNLHFLPIADLDDDDEVARAMDLNDRLVEAAIEMGGTTTGEHGVGIGKRQFMRDEHGDAVDLMRKVKETVDPNGVMNPGKVLPPSAE